MKANICTMKCPKCGNTATKSKPADQFKCDHCGWKL
jgi:transposase